MMKGKIMSTKKETIKNKRYREKYPDTDTFHFHNANPKTNITSDCVFRAISTALNQSWDQTYMEMVELGIKSGYTPTNPKVIEKYLKQKGWIKHKQPKYEDGTKYTGIEFCSTLDDEFLHKNIVANIGTHHMVAIVGKKIYDIWNSSRGCVGNYWTL